MDSITTNYKSENDIRKELTHVDLDNFVDFGYNGQIDFVRCPYCNGPTLGHLEPKCPRLDYDKDILEKFDRYLKGMEEFRKARTEKQEEKKKQEAQSTANIVRLTIEQMNASTPPQR